MPDISVVINTRDHPESLEKCLRALEKQTADPAAWEVVAVDDGSKSPQALRPAQRFPGPAPCRTVRIAPSGRAAARNAGVRHASAPLVLFLGDDIMAAPDLIERHLEAHATRLPAPVAVTGHVVDATETPSVVFAKWWNNLLLHDIPDPENAGFARFYTCNASAPRQAILDAGGFDENFQLYGWEDIDLGFRLERLGLRVVYESAARATHRHPGACLEGLCRREYELGFTAAYHYGKWAEEPQVQAQRFWRGEPGDVAIGPAWRRGAARRAIRFLERFLPLPFLLHPLYSRLLWSQRFQGLQDGARHYAPLLERMRPHCPDAPTTP